MRQMGLFLVPHPLPVPFALQMISCITMQTMHGASLRMFTSIRKAALAECSYTILTKSKSARFSIEGGQFVAFGELVRCARDHEQGLSWQSWLDKSRVLVDALSLAGLHRSGHPGCCIQKGLHAAGPHCLPNAPALGVDHATASEVSFCDCVCLHLWAKQNSDFRGQWLSLESAARPYSLPQFRRWHFTFAWLASCLDLELVGLRGTAVCWPHHSVWHRRIWFLSCRRRLVGQNAGSWSMASIATSQIETFFQRSKGWLRHCRQSWCASKYRGGGGWAGCLELKGHVMSPAPSTLNQGWIWMKVWVEGWLTVPQCNEAFGEGQGCLG